MGITQEHKELDYYNSIQVVDRYGNIEEEFYWKIHIYAGPNIVDKIKEWCYSNLVRFNINEDRSNLFIKIFDIEDFTLFELTWH